MKNVLILFLSIFLFASCGSKSTTEDRKIIVDEIVDETTEIVSEKDEEVANSEKMTVKAKFVEFQFGDSEHYMFEDESGKEWHFKGNESEEFMFAMELPESEANEDNQGFGSNKDLQSKWFNITYAKREQPAYIDGPMEIAAIIMEAKLAK
ncbi:MAG: hypothetical protein ACJAWV_001077 [Flammeovirgaceae bacterium]|jgi:hypothetical protein